MNLLNSLNPSSYCHNKNQKQNFTADIAGMKNQAGGTSLYTFNSSSCNNLNASIQEHNQRLNINNDRLRVSAGADDSVKLLKSNRFNSLERQKLLDINEKLTNQLERNMQTLSVLNQNIMKKDQSLIQNEILLKNRENQVNSLKIQLNDLSKSMMRLLQMNQNQSQNIPSKPQRTQSNSPSMIQPFSNLQDSRPQITAKSSKQGNQNISDDILGFPSSNNTSIRLPSNRVGHSTLSMQPPQTSRPFATTISNVQSRQSSNSPEKAIFAAASETLLKQHISSLSSSNSNCRKNQINVVSHNQDEVNKRKDQNCIRFSDTFRFSNQCIVPDKEYKSRNKAKNDKLVPQQSSLHGGVGGNSLNSNGMFRSSSFCNKQYHTQQNDFLSEPQKRVINLFKQVDNMSAGNKMQKIKYHKQMQHQHQHQHQNLIQQPYQQEVIASDLSNNGGNQMMLKSIEGGIKTLASSGLSSFFKLSESIGKNGGNTYAGDFLGKQISKILSSVDLKSPQPITKLNNKNNFNLNYDSELGKYHLSQHQMDGGNRFEPSTNPTLNSTENSRQSGTIKGFYQKQRKNAKASPFYQDENQI